MNIFSSIFENQFVFFILIFLGIALVIFIASMLTKVINRRIENSKQRKLLAQAKVRENIKEDKEPKQEVRGRISQSIVEKILSYKQIVSKQENEVVQFYLNDMLIFKLIDKESEILLYCRINPKHTQLKKFNIIDVKVHSMFENTPSLFKIINEATLKQAYRIVELTIKQNTINS